MHPVSYTHLNVRAVAADLEVAVVAAGASGAAHIADELALLDRLTGVHHQMCIRDRP